MTDRLDGAVSASKPVVEPGRRRNARNSRIGMAVLAAIALGCSSPLLEGTTFTCSVDADCKAGEICAPLNGPQVCQASVDVPIRVGTSGPLEGPLAALGTQVVRGLNALFARVNAEGGVHGRSLELIAVDNANDPVVAVQRARMLLDVRETSDDPDQPDVRGPNGVFALLGTAGTPAALATASLANKNQVVLFGPVSGAQARLRDGELPHVFNYRAGFRDERFAFLEYVHRGRTPAVIQDPATDHQRVFVLAPRDASGEAAYVGMANAFENRIGPLPRPDALPRIRFDGEDVTSVEAAANEAIRLLSLLLERGTAARESAAIMMIDAGQAGARFVRDVKDWANEEASRARRLDLVFVHPSSGGEALIGALEAAPASYLDVASGTPRAYVDGIIVTQVVPHPGSEAPAVASYRDDVRAYDEGPLSFTSLEGYLAAKIFVEALQRIDAKPTTEGLRRALEGAGNFDAGIDVELSFSASDHQASDVVWGTQFSFDGRSEVRFVWQGEEDLRLTPGSGDIVHPPPEPGPETTTPCSEGSGCQLSEPCVLDADCQSRRCEAGVCAAAACNDARHNGGETGVDCGGSCAPCGEGLGCAADADCDPSLYCEAARRVCTRPSCGDGRFNGDEVDVDCGGSCGSCPAGASCREAAHCESGVCDATDCDEGLSTCCQPPRCDDGVRNGSESIVDCGDSACGPCLDGSPCDADSQCESGACIRGICERPSCTNGAVSGLETDIDCGGPHCPRCETGQRCSSATDCLSTGGCDGGRCSSCGDGQLNGTETALDCGGQCGATCPDGAFCRQDADCAGWCVTGLCCNADRQSCGVCALPLAASGCPDALDADGIEQCFNFFACVGENLPACQAGMTPECTGSGAPCDANAFSGEGSTGMRQAATILSSLGC